MARSLVLVVLFLGGCGGDKTGEKADLSGVVRIGPTPGPCVVDTPCSRPADGVELEFARSGHSVVRATTDERGRYEVRLERGTYQVRAVGYRSPATLYPTTVTVTDDARRNFSIDSGVR